jgi:PAS domain S-box-containing protein
VSSDNALPAGADDDGMFRLLVENVRDYAIFMLDPNGIVTSWNAGAEHIKGYAKQEIIGRHFSTFYPPDAIARRWPQHELNMARLNGRFEDEGWRLRKDGSAFWANVVITPVYDADRQLLGFAKITRDLTARRKIEELQRTERQMNEFLAMLGHELRNPLSPIQSALDVMERKLDDVSTATWARAIIRRQTSHLSRLVDDLLDVSRITRGRISLRREAVDLKTTITQVVESMRSLIAARAHTLEITLAEEPLFVHADSTRLAQILSNIIGNAIKYTPHGGRIAVNASALEGLATVVVTDNGIGMSADLVPRVFDLFVQGDRGLERPEGGLGVGLTIAKRLVDLLGGTLSAGSAGPGLGSRFSVGFPLLPLEQVPQQTPPPAPVATARARRVLIVDDNEDAAESLAALVAVLGHEPMVLHDGREALGVATEQRPDLMLLDIGLPGMDGFEIARRLRGMPEFDGVTLVACTGYGRDEDVRRMGEAGFDRHLVKPVSADELEALLAEE